MCRSRTLFVCFGVIWLALGSLALAQESLESVLANLKAVQANDAASVDELREAVADVQRIVDDFPASDAAVSILLGEAYEGIVFDAFGQRLERATQGEAGPKQSVAQSDPDGKKSCLAAAIADQSGAGMRIGFSTDASGELSGLPQIIAPENPNSEARSQYLKVVAALEKCAPYRSQGGGTQYQLELGESGALSLAALTASPTERAEAGGAEAGPAIALPVGSEATETALGLDKQAVRDVQARLLVIGHDPSGLDGVVGKGMRAAIRAWQTSVNAEPTGYLNEAQLAALKAQSQGSLEEWLRSDENARLYETPPPPPVLAIGPQNMSGNWRYTTNCGSGSRLGKIRITGTFSMRHAGGQTYSGTLSNSQGLRGRVNATLRGRSVSAVTNFGLLIGKVNVTARVDDDKLVLRGRDSNGCAFYASKR